MITWIEANLKGLKKCNFQKTSLFRKASSMGVATILKIMLEEECRNRINFAPLAS